MSYYFKNKKDQESKTLQFLSVSMNFLILQESTRFISKIIKVPGIQIHNFLYSITLPSPYVL